MKRPAGSSQTLARRPAKRSRRVRKPKGTPEMYQKGQVFPDVMTTTLRYNSNMVAIDPSAASTYYTFMLNGPFDFDADNIIGNKQPLYYDELLTADGPYRTYTVKSWKTKVQIINDSQDPLLCYWAQSSTTTDADTLIEVQNLPNVQELILTQRDGDNNSGTITSYGNMEKIFGTRLDQSAKSGNFGANPTSLARGVLFLYNPGGLVTTPVNAWIKITHDFVMELSTADAVVS